MCFPSELPTTDPKLIESRYHLKLITAAALLSIGLGLVVVYTNLLLYKIVIMLLNWYAWCLFEDKIVIIAFFLSFVVALTDLLYL